jgi:hypothetical protein
MPHLGPTPLLAPSVATPLTHSILSRVIEANVLSTIGFSKVLRTVELRGIGTIVRAVKAYAQGLGSRALVEGADAVLHRYLRPFQKPFQKLFQKLLMERAAM